jgi:hypothetical protein
MTGAIMIYFSSDAYINLVCESVLIKNIPDHLKGILNGLYQFSGILGMMIYSKIAGYIFDAYGPTTPFIVMASLDMAYGIILVFLSFTGYFKRDSFVK